MPPLLPRRPIPLLLLITITVLCVFFYRITWLVSHVDHAAAAPPPSRLSETQHESPPLSTPLAPAPSAIKNQQLKAVPSSTVPEPEKPPAPLPPIFPDVVVLSSVTPAAPSPTPQPAPKPCGAHLERNIHFVDRAHWKSIKPDEIAVRRGHWQHFLSTDVQKMSVDKYNFTGHGIVFTAAGYTLARAKASIHILRKVGCTLPIQVWYIGDELNERQLTELKAMNVTPKDILVEQQRYPELASFKISHAYGQSRNYHIKSVVLLLTEFRHILYLDSDNNALRDPTFLFHSKQYQETGAIFWPDFWKFPQDNPMWEITGLTCEDEWEQESGQLVIDKVRSWRALLLATFFQKQHDFYFSIILGDKDTFRFGWKLTNTPYHMINRPCAIGGRVRQQRFCGHTMMQFGPDDELLFAHTTALKSTNSIRNGNTWESIQYFERVDAVEITTSTPGIASYDVAYPYAVEYGGGVDKSEEEGGVGSEVLTNPCLEIFTKRLTFETTSESIAKIGKERLDSYRIITQDFPTMNNGAYRKFEESYFEGGGPISNAKGLCGNGHRGSTKCPFEHECCSSWGWCGVTPDHCGVECVGGPCYRQRKLPETISPGFTYCGGGQVGFGLCNDPKTHCCSRFGWCGTSPDHCGKANCLSGPCESAEEPKK